MMAIDLYCGLGGWAEGLLAEGYTVVGFDIERHDYGTGGYPGQLVLQNATTLHGSQFKDATVIVASPPCQEYSYMAMPWKRAKQIIGALNPDGNFAKPDFPEGYTGSRTIAELNLLFDTCFRLQREASEAAGRYIPLIVENVRGAQRWVGRAKANFGSYYLWGDVGMVGKRVVAGVPRFGVSVAPMRTGKMPGFSLNPGPDKWGAHTTGGYGNAMKRNPDGTDHGSGLKMGWDNSERGKCRRNDSSKVPGISFGGEKGSTSPGFNVTAAQRYREATKGGGDWFSSGENCSIQRRHGSKSDSRKAASASIAKIPFPLAQYIARCFKNHAEVCA